MATGQGQQQPRTQQHGFAGRVGKPSMSRLRVNGASNHASEQRLASQDRSWPQLRAASSSAERQQSNGASRQRPSTGRLSRRSRPSFGEDSAGTPPVANASDAAASTVAAIPREAHADEGLPLPPPLESPRSQVLSET